MIDEKLFGRGLVCPRCFYREESKRSILDGFHAPDLEEILDDYFEGMEHLDREAEPEWSQLSVRRFLGKTSFRRGLFLWEDCVVHLDACVAHAKGMRSSISLIESKRVKNTAIAELAFQRYVMQKLGLPVTRSYALVFNKHYRRSGSVNPHEMLILCDVSEEVEEFFPAVEGHLENLRRILKNEEPVLTLAPYGEKDLACSLTSECYHFPKDHPATIYGITPARLRALVLAGYTRIQDVPDRFLCQKARIQKKAVLEKRVHVESEGVRRKLSEIEGPVSALDFEAFAPMVPLFEGDGVHLPLVYQCSVAWEDEERIASSSYVYEGREDPRQAVVEALLTMVPGEGSILVYNQSFERSRLKELGLRYPWYKEQLRSLEKRLVDLLPLFSSFLVYHPDQQGSTKLKSVAKAFLPGSYRDVAVLDGRMALNLYEEFWKEEDERTRSRIVRDLRVYGRWDARVLIELYRLLMRLKDKNSETTRGLP